MLRRCRVSVYAISTSGSVQPVVRLECRIALIDTLASWSRAQTDRSSYMLTLALHLAAASAQAGRNAAIIDLDP